MSAVIEDIKRAVFRLDGSAPAYGGPSLTEAVDDVSAEAALFRLEGAGHCIWEIVLHAAYWRHEVAHALSDGDVARLDRGPENWPALPASTDDANWQADRQLLEQSEAALLAALDGFDAQRWSDLPRGGGDWPLGQLAVGLIAHDAYHIGQVALLKKAAGVRLK